MPLVIETGSVVTGANSFVSVSDARAFASARASTLPASDSAVEAALIGAKDYLETFRDRFQGAKVSPGVQPLQFPRKGVYLEGWDVPENVIPQLLKDAQCQLCLDSFDGAGNPVDLMPSGDGREVIREKVDVIETEYSPGAGGSPQPRFTKALHLISPLLRSGGALRVIRA